MRSSAVAAGDTALATQYNNLRKDAYRASYLLAHEQSTPDLTLYVEPGVFYIGATRVIYAGGNSPTFTAPVTNPRIDLLTINSSGTLARTAGAEAGSPSAPAYPAGVMVLCEVYNRVGQTTIRDTDTAGQGYISNDIRGIGFAQSIVNAQIAAAAAIDISKVAFNGDFLPTADNTDDIGSASYQVANVYATQYYKNGVAFVGAKFGGTGSDGALSISSGTTTVSAASANVLVKNYTSISITSTGSLAFNNPATTGTIVCILSQGNVTLTATTPITTVGMGAAGGNGGVDTNGSDGQIPFRVNTHVTTASKGGLKGTSIGAGSTGGTQFTQNDFIVTQAATAIFKRVELTSGGGGAGGGSAGATGGAGSRGGGGLYIECQGDINFTGTISVAGTIGANCAANGSGGGGGGAGMCVIVYNTATSVAGTISSPGGAGGNCANYGNASWGGGGGASYWGAGGLGNNGAGGSGAGGGGGAAYGAGGGAGGAAGATQGGFVFQNLYIV
jgi:hypothetical protein